MKILALEFSSDRRSVAVLDSQAPNPDGLGACEVETDGRSTHACAMMEAVLRQAGLTRDAIDHIAVGLGPGSYTGIRVAIALAEGWRLARGVRLIGVSSVECLAAQVQAAGVVGPVLIALDAQRGEYYVAGYELSATARREIDPLRLSTSEELEARRRTAASLIGPGLAARFPEARTMFPDATTLARLAVGRPSIPADEGLEPIYLRPVSFVKAPPPRQRG